MPRGGPRAPGLAPALLLLLLLLACRSSSRRRREVPDLTCHTDFMTEVVCQWGTEDTTDCAREFRLNVSSDTGVSLPCIPENRRIPASASPTCVCIIHEETFFGTKYHLLLVTGTNKSKKYSFYLPGIVKPRPLRNLTVTKSKRRSFILTWNKGYEPPHIIYNLPVSYQLKISAEGQKQPAVRSIKEQAQQYELFPDGLLPGRNYTASIRYFLESWGGFWSEWSSPCWWLNDLEPEPGGQLWWIILLACFLVTALVPATYCCFVRLKRKWWDEIPSPDKSQAIKDVGKKLRLSPWQGEAYPGKWEAFLTPEASSVEPSLTVCSPVADPGPGTQMEEGEEPVFRDEALVGLFKDILWDGDGTEDTGPPDPVQEEPPPAGAPEPAFEGLCLLGETPRKSPGSSSGSGYQNSAVAASSQEASPAPEQAPSGCQAFPPSPYKLLLLPQSLPSTPYRAVVTDSLGPQAEGPGSSWAPPAPPPFCYKTLGSLLGQPTAPLPPLWERLADFSGAERAQPLSSWPPSLEDGLFLPPQQEASSQNVPARPCATGACLPGYRPLRAAPQAPGCLRLGSPYRPLLEVFGSAPKEGPLEPTLRTLQAAGKVWHAAPWEEPLTLAFHWCMEEEEEEGDSGQEHVRKGTESFLPQMPIATL